MKLYDLKIAPNCKRLRMFLAAKGIEIEKVQVDPRKGETREGWFMEKNPLGAVPVLELDDGTCIADSMAISTYLEHLHPDPNLMGRDPLEKAMITMWHRRTDELMLTEACFAVHHLSTDGDPYWGFAEGRRRNREFGENSKEIILMGMGLLELQLSANKYVAGDRFTIADCAAYAAIEPAAHVGVPIPDYFENVRRWADAIADTPMGRA